MSHSATASSVVLDSLDIVAGSQLLLGELFLEDWWRGNHYLMDFDYKEYLFQKPLEYKMTKHASLGRDEICL